MKINKSNIAIKQGNPICISNNRIWESLDSIINKRSQPSTQTGLLMMKNGNKIVKCQEGSGTWTSEDIGNPVYSKKKPLSIKQQEQIFIKDRQEQGLKNFDKAAKIAYGVARLVPGPIGLATDFIDAGNNLYNIFKNRNGNITLDTLRAIVNPISRKLTKTKKLLDATEKYGADIVNDMSDILFKGLKHTVNGIDQVQDAEELYNEVISKKRGGSLTSDGRRFKFKDSTLIRNSKALNNKRDMRKKFIKSDRPTYFSNKIRKGQQGLQFARYEPLTEYNYNVFSPFYLPKNIEELYFNNEQVETPISVDLITPEPEKQSKEEPKIVSKQEPITKFKNTSEFVRTMKPIYQKVLANKGLNTSYADYLVAQAALESNWGKSQSGKNNLSGIKVIASQKGKGLGTVRRTREVVNGKDVYINDEFRDFNNLEDFANYHVNLLNGKRYQAFNGDFIDRVVKGGYATDPRYSKVLNSIYNSIKQI